MLYLQGDVALVEQQYKSIVAICSRGSLMNNMEGNRQMQIGRAAVCNGRTGDMPLRKSWHLVQNSAELAYWMTSFDHYMASVVRPDLQSCASTLALAWRLHHQARLFKVAWSMTTCLVLKYP